MMPNENNSSGESEPIGARGGEIAGSERSDSPRGDAPDDLDDGNGWGSEIAIALGLVGGVLLLAGLLFVGLGGLGGDGTAPAGANNTTNTTNTSEDLEDVQEDDVENDTEPAPPENDTDGAGNGGDPTEPEPAPEEPEPDESEPDNETELNETEPQNETEPDNETRNETNELEPQPGATAVIQVVDQASAPVEGEPVTVELMDGSTVEYTTDENGEVVIELVAGDPSDVARFNVRVRDQEQVVYIQRDDVHGVQEVVFEVGEESDPSGNETGTNELAVATTF